METPLVVCVGQRPGPATGLPTWTCQSDLDFVLAAGHGEVPRVVLTPSTVQEHFELMRVAFELAEKFHLVVLIISVNFALESYASMPKPAETYSNQRYSFAADPLPSDDSYRRFEITEEGFSPRSVPGQPHGLSVTNSYEHDEFGYATESAQLTQAMNEKRHRKLKSVAPHVPTPILIGPDSAEITVVGWGSTRLVLEDVMRRFEKAGQPNKLNVIHFPCIWPFPTEAFTKLAQNAKKLVMVEGNTTGQMEKLIYRESGVKMHHQIHRYDGRPFYAEELMKEVESL
jgi:2-oxoglutarate/2-oxoacid ferredoxin oxidoreductase subunit alpha